MNDNISPHFLKREFTFSETAARMGREVIPTDLQWFNVERLCNDLLEPIRNRLGRVMVITSGVRPDWLNLAIGGSATSAHMDGLAADVKVAGMTPTVFARWVQNNGFVVDQCIKEFDSWVHLSVAKAGEKPRQQFLTARKVNGKTVYEQGINE